MGDKVYKVNILKLDHRPERDKRVTTHCALVARAFGAQGFYYSGVEDNRIKQNVDKICKKFGGALKVSYCESPISFIKKWPGLKIHLTMYGENAWHKIDEIKCAQDDFLIIIGGPKVPAIYYEITNFNLSVTNQPHSEIAALAIILYKINPKFLIDNFVYNDAEIKILPSNKGKKVITLK